MCAIRPIPLPEQILLFRHTDTVVDPLGIGSFVLHQTTDGEYCHGVGIELLQILHHFFHMDIIAFQSIYHDIPITRRIILIPFQMCHIISVEIARMNILQTPPDQNLRTFLQGLISQLQIQIAQLNQQLLPGRVAAVYRRRIFRIILRIYRQLTTLCSHSV